MCLALKKFIDHNFKGSISHFAAEKKFKQASVSRYVSGERIPRPDEMRKLYQVTNGAVTPNDFYSLPRLESERNQLNLFGQPAISSQSFPESSSHNLTQNPCQQGT